MKGWIKLHKKLSDSKAIYDNESMGRWIKVLLSVSLEDTLYSHKDIELEVISGQCVRSYSDWADIFGISKTSTVRYLTFLEDNGMVSLEQIGSGKNKTLLLTICNWDKYQVEDSYVKDIDTEQFITKKPEHVDKLENTAKEIIDYLNVLAKKKKGFTYRKEYISLIKTLLRSKIDDVNVDKKLITMVLDYKVPLCLEDDFMKEYVRPQTLFAKRKFLQYFDEMVNDDNDFMEKQVLSDGDEITLKILSNFDENSTLKCKRGDGITKDFLVSDIKKAVKLGLIGYNFVSS